MTLDCAQIEFDDQGRLVSTAYGDIYFQPEHSAAESDYVFLQMGGFHDAIKKGTGDLTVAELGFGTGLNFLLCLQAWQTRRDKSRRLHYISFEKHPIQKDDLQKIYAYWPHLSEYADQFLAQYPVLTAGIHARDLNSYGCDLTLCLGDVRDMLPDMQFTSNIWFLDGFAPAKNPSMWDEKLWRPMARNTETGGRIATFTAAGFVRRGLTEAGFKIEKIKGYGRKRDMVVGTLNTSGARAPFDAKRLPIPPRLPAIKSVAVIGAGIAGCALADALCRYNIDVTIYDRADNLASGASGNPRAAVYPKLGAQNTIADQMYRTAFCYTQNFYNQLDGSTFDACGVFQMDRNEDSKSRHQKIAARGLNSNLVEYLSCDTVTGLNLDCGGLYFPNGGTINPPALCAALLSRAQKTGHLTTVYNFDFNAVDKIPADIIILANTENLNALPETKWLPLEIVRGQITVWGGSDSSQNLKTVICHKGYITPHHNGHILGATFDKGAADNHDPTTSNHARNMAQLMTEIPTLKCDYEMADLTGRRANRIASPDRLPLCGPVIDIDQFKKDFEKVAQDAKTEFTIAPAYHENLYVLGALGSHGMTTAPWLSEILARHITGAPLPISKTLYNGLCPARFAVRDLIRQ